MFAGRSAVLCLIIGVLSINATLPRINILDKWPPCDRNDSTLTKTFRAVSNSSGSEEVIWSLCPPKDTQHICPQNSIICLKRSGSHPSMMNLGDSFKLISHDLNIALRSQNGAICEKNPLKNYTAYLTVGDIQQPSFEHTDCEYNIHVPFINIEYPCVERVGDLHLDFHLLRDDFYVKEGDKTFMFNVCYAVGGCSKDISSCVSGSQNDSLGEISSRRIAYDEESAAVEFHFLSGKGKARKETIVELKCDWNKLHGIPKYLPSPSKKKFKFSVESILGCIKLPMVCKLEDSEQSEYDLSVLHKTGTAWTLTSKQNKAIRMNICGPLDHLKGDCKDREAQICEETPDGKYISYGGILTNKRLENNVVKMTFSYGSVCCLNATCNLTFTTNVDFKCSFVEAGPALLDIDGCQVNILWETPAACPNSMVFSKNLIIDEPIGKRNLTDLCKPDRLHWLDQSTYIRYNLCAPLVDRCNDSANVSACLHRSKGREIVLGYSVEEKLLSRNGVIGMEFRGDQGKILNVSFACDYDAPSDGHISLQIMKDYNVYRMSVKAPGACLTKPTKAYTERGCIFTIGGDIRYNLTALSRSDSNYRIRDKSGDLEYLLNICKPIVTEPDVLCKQNSGACVWNRTEPIFKRRFSSIGSFPESFEIDKGQLVLKFLRGNLCHNRLGDAATVIRFVCADIEGSGPELVSVSSDCSYEFKWTTRYACATCVIPLEGDSKLNLTGVKHKELTLRSREGTNLTFNICSDRYTEAMLDGTLQTHRAIRKVNQTSITMTISATCDSTTKNGWNRVRIFFGCRGSPGLPFEIVSNENCTVELRCNSWIFCKQKYEVVNAEKKTEETNVITDVTIPIAMHREPIKDCVFDVGSTKINLNHLIPFKVVSDSDHTYTVGVQTGPEALCDGYICKGDVTIASLRICPNVSRESHERTKITFNHTFTSLRQRFTAVLLFECADAAAKPRILAESATSLTLAYPYHDICSPSSSNVGLIAGITVPMVLLLLVAGSTIWWKKRRQRYEHINRSRVYVKMRAD